MLQITLMYTFTGYVFAMLALYMLGAVKLIQEESRPPLIFAYLPFAHGYARAIIAGQRGRYLRILVPLSSALLAVALMFFSIYLLIATALFYVVTRCFLNYYTYNRKHAILFTFLSILIPLSSGIWIYSTYRKGRYSL